MRMILRQSFLSRLAGALALLSLTGPAHAEEALVAVAANFAEVVEQLTPKFEQATGHKVVVTTGATGKLYTQIKAGAPFHILLSADAKTPAKLASEDAAVAGTGFTYAIGKLALWSPNMDQVATNGVVTLAKGDFRHLAMANPDLAPYGVAAQQVLEALGFKEALLSKLVMGENIGQTFSMVATGNAELGFVALSAIQSPTKQPEGSFWVVPQELFQPIKQDAILLNPGKDNPAAKAFLDFLKSAEAHTIIESFGYGFD